MLLQIIIYRLSLFKKKKKIAPRILPPRKHQSPISPHQSPDQPLSLLWPWSQGTLIQHLRSINGASIWPPPPKKVCPLSPCRDLCHHHFDLFQRLVISTPSRPASCSYIDISLNFKKKIIIFRSISSHCFRSLHQPLEIWEGIQKIL